MDMTRAHLSAAVAGIASVLVAGTAAADGFGGFGGREDGYLVGRDRICTPLTVEGGTARGAPACAKANADEVAHLSVKPAKPVRGKDASHRAAARGRVIEVSAKDAVVVTWESPDPVSRVVDVYVSTYANLVAVEYAVRRGSRDVTEVVAFDLRSARGGAAAVEPTPEQPRPAVEAPPATPELTKAVKAARKAAKGSAKKALAAWDKVLALDPEHSEARYGVAAARAKGKQAEEALAALEALAGSARADAIEFLIAARFDKAFAALRAEPRFRAATGLDREGGTFYERLMGLGGKWEQAGTSCDAPGVALALAKDRTFKLTVTSVCSGARFEDTFKGRWEMKEPALHLILPNKGKDDDVVACAVERDGDEDAIRCALDADLSFVVRPVRR